MANKILVLKIGSETLKLASRRNVEADDGEWVENWALDCEPAELERFIDEAGYAEKSDRPVIHVEELDDAEGDLHDLRKEIDDLRTDILHLHDSIADAVDRALDKALGTKHLENRYPTHPQIGSDDPHRIATPAPESSDPLIQAMQAEAERNAEAEAKKADELRCTFTRTTMLEGKPQQRRCVLAKHDEDQQHVLDGSDIPF